MPVANDSPAIETFGLSRRFGAQVAVENLDLHVARGRIFGLLGPEGAGKTTTIRMLLGLLRPSAGGGRVLGLDIVREGAAIRGRVGTMLGTPAFYQYMSGHNNLRLLVGGIGRSGYARVVAALAAVGLDERGADRVRSYTPGMRRRLALAAALIGRPELLILDEPAAGLDPAEAAEIRNLIRALGSAGLTIFLSSRQPHEVEQICDEAAIIGRGRLMIQAEVRDLIGRAGLLVEAEPLPLVRAVIDSLGLEAHPAGPRSLCLKLDPAEAPRLVAALVHAGAQVHQVTPQRLRSEEQLRALAEARR